MIPRQRRLEGIDLTALWVHARHDMFDGAILAGGAHSLKNQKHSPFVLCVEFVLQLRKGLDSHRQSLFAARFGKLAGFSNDFIDVHRPLISTP